MTTPERRRVLRIIARLNVGGPALHVSLLGKHLSPERYQTRLVHGTVAPGEADMADLVSEQDVIVIPELGRAVRPWHDLVAFAKLLRVVLAFRPHVIHTHTAKAGALGRAAGVMARLLWRRSGPRLVHTYHGHVFHGYFRPWQNVVVRVVERALARFTDRIVAISPTLEADIVDRYGVCPRSKVRVVALGLDLSRFAQGGRHGTLREELGCTPDTCLVGIVGRLAPVKNHRLLLEAAARLSDEPQLRFAIVGGGELLEELRAQAVDLGVDRRVRFLGWRRDLEAVYPEFDIVALTSLNEGTPVSLIEAMAAGRAVVATAVGGVPDVVDDGQTGWLVESGDVSGLARCLRFLATDAGARRAVGERARARVLERYTAERLALDIGAVYDELFE